MLDKIKRRLGITDDAEDVLLQDLIEDSQSYFNGLADTEMFDEKYNLVKMHKRNEKIIVKMGKIRK